jgi:dTDP-4-amino-4,6-dideoxygalactose transaminase
MRNTKVLRIRCADWSHSELFAFTTGLFVRTDAIKLKHKLSDSYKSDVFLLNSARDGIFKILQQLKIDNPKKNKVLIPDFICDSVPEIVNKVGLNVIKVKVARDLNICPLELQNNIDELSLAIIMPHMYGAIADIESIIRISKKNGIYLIDDAAQVTGVSRDNKLLGTFGDFGVLSFAQGKTVVTGVRGSGGALINSCKYPLRINETHPKGWGRLTNIWHFWAVYHKKGHWAIFEYYRERIIKLFSSSECNHYLSDVSISHAESAIALKQLEALPKLISLTESKAVRCYELAKKLNTISIPQWDEGPCFLTRLIIQTSIISPEKLKCLLSNYSIESKFVYSQGSRVYDGSNISGLLELPWLGMNFEDEIYLFNKLSQIEKSTNLY